MAKPLRCWCPGDPALRSSSLRIAQAIARAGRIALVYEVIPGISSVQALCAAHRVALNEIAGSVLLTTGRRLALGLPADAESVVVMLDAQDSFLGLNAPSFTFTGGVPGLAAAGPDRRPAGRGGATHRRHPPRLRGRHGWIMDTCCAKPRPDQPLCGNSTVSKPLEQRLERLNILLLMRRCGVQHRAVDHAIVLAVRAVAHQQQHQVVAVAPLRLLGLLAAQSSWFAPGVLAVGAVVELGGHRLVGRGVIDRVRCGEGQGAVVAQQHQHTIVGAVALVDRPRQVGQGEAQVIVAVGLGRVERVHAVDALRLPGRQGAGVKASAALLSSRPASPRNIRCIVRPSAC
nr:SAM-dependent methyltransferase [Pseudomonas sp. KNUC1026]